MENILIRNIINNEENKINENKGISLYNNINKKHKKYIACNYNWKEFYSDEEDNNTRQKSDLNNLNNIPKKLNKRKLSHNSIMIYKENIQKRYTIDNKFVKAYKLEYNDKINKNRNNKLSNKKVTFNIVKYINVESYKKYYAANTDDEINSNIIENKADLKCTCFIF